jgi:hypothetical protein
MSVRLRTARLVHKRPLPWGVTRVNSNIVLILDDPRKLAFPDCEILHNGEHI